MAASIKLGEAELDAEGPVLALIREAKRDLDAGLNSLRATVHGIHPQVLQDHGLIAALSDVASSYGSHISIFAPHPLPQLSPSVLAAGYFFGTEALTNAAKHAPGAPVSVLITSDASLHISVVDEGPGGARVIPGHGLAGMAERLAAFGGRMQVHSPEGGPTKINCEIPLLLERGSSGLRRGTPEWPSRGGCPRWDPNAASCGFAVGAILLSSAQSVLRACGRIMK